MKKHSYRKNTARKESGSLRIYTDGSLRRGKGGWAWCVAGSSLFDKGTVLDSDCNAMEILAVVQAMAWAGRRAATIYTDSVVVWQGFNATLDQWIKQGWTNSRGLPVKYRKYWQRLYRLRERYPHIRVKRVRTNEDWRHNRRADALAREASR